MSQLHSTQDLVESEICRDALVTHYLPPLPPLERIQQSPSRHLSTQSVIIAPGIADQLTKRLCERMETANAKMTVAKFPNSETRIEIHESVRDRHAFVVSRICAPVNDSLLETILLIQALKLADARRITVVLPYFPYARQDRKADTRPPISAKAVTDILRVVGAHQIVTVDIHATQIEGFFDGPFENLSGLNQIVRPLIEAEGSDLVIVSPDAGGAKRAEKFARQVEHLCGTFAPLVVMSKFRPGLTTQPVVTLSVGEEFLTNKTCVLVDDMIDTGGSIIAAATALKERGAARVIVCATHGVFSNEAMTRLANAKTASGVTTIDGVFVTDTLPISDAPENFRIVSIAPLIAEAIQRLDRPMGTLHELKERTDLGQMLPGKSNS